MSTKKVKKSSFFLQFFQELKLMGADIVHLYKNFIHWNLAKIGISIWGIVVGIFMAAPFFLFCVILGSIDSIPWIQIMADPDPTHSVFIQGLAAAPFSLIAMTFLMLVATLSFLFGSTYVNLLFAHLSLKYLEGKRGTLKERGYFLLFVFLMVMFSVPFLIYLKFKKKNFVTKHVIKHNGHAFSIKHILTFIALISWNLLYILAIGIIWVGLYFFIDLSADQGIISVILAENLSRYLVLIVLFVLSYMVYRILFGYIILADSKPGAKLHSAKQYINKSIKLTKGTSYFKFLMVSVIFFIFMMPFNALETFLNTDVDQMKDTYNYNAGFTKTIEKDKMPYYEHIVGKYEIYNQQELISQIEKRSIQKFIYFFVMYFLFGGLTIFMLSSYYRRILLKK